MPKKENAPAKTKITLEEKEIHTKQKYKQVRMKMEKRKTKTTLLPYFLEIRKDERE